MRIPAILNRLDNLRIRCSLTEAGAARAIKTNLTKSFDIKGVEPLPFSRAADRPEKIYYFSNISGKWEEYLAVVKKTDIKSVANDQLVVAEAKTVIQLIVTSCAAITLYDAERKVGAAMHFHNMDRDIYRGYISLALYKMGILDYGRMTKVVARIMGVAPIPDRVQEQKEWVKDIKAFLKACSIKVVSDEIGRRMTAFFDVSNGSIEYE